MYVYVQSMDSPHKVWIHGLCSTIHGLHRAIQGLRESIFCAQHNIHIYSMYTTCMSWEEVLMSRSRCVSVGVAPSVSMATKRWGRRSLTSWHSPSSRSSPRPLSGPTTGTRYILQYLYIIIYVYIYLKVTIICRYIFLRFWNSVHFTGIKFCVG